MMASPLIMMFPPLSLRKMTPILLVFFLRADFPNPFIVLTLPLGNPTKQVDHILQLAFAESEIKAYQLTYQVIRDRAK